MLGFCFSLFIPCQYFNRNQQGVTSIEYGLIAIAIAAFIVYIINGKGTFIYALLAKFDSLATSVSASVFGLN